MPVRLTPEQRQDAVTLYGDGYTLRQTAEMVRCHLETVRKVVRAAGVPVRSRQWRRSR